MNPSVTYRAAIIGLGFVGTGDPVSGERIGQNPAGLDGTHLSAWQNHGRVRLVAGCDLDEGRRQRFEQRSAARADADWQEMLDRERPELVSIATYTPSHAPLTIACAERGVRVVYCEKPIAASVAEAERMLAACDAAGALLVINHNRRFNPNYRQLSAEIADGMLGELTSIYVHWPTGRFGCVGTHLIDAARMLTGREITAVCSVLDESEKADCRGSEFRDPGGWGLLKMQGGLMMLLNAPNHALGPTELIIEGTRGRAVTGGDAIELHFSDGRRDIRPSRRDEATSMDRAAAEIVAWLDGTAAFSVSPHEAMKTFEAIAALHASHAAGTWVPLPLSEADRRREIQSG
ncbi:MAG: Gfo/Idh/MocA family protein [Planctomycetaceae bacterium]